MKKARVGRNRIYGSHRRFRRPSETIYLEDTHSFDENDNERSGDWEEDDLSAMEGGEIPAYPDPLSSFQSRRKQSPTRSNREKSSGGSRNKLKGTTPWGE